MLEQAPNGPKALRQLRLPLVRIHVGDDGDIKFAPDWMWTCSQQQAPGTVADKSFGQFGAYMARLVSYYNRGYMRQAKREWPGKPLWITEMNANADWGNDPFKRPQGPFGVASARSFAPARRRHSRGSPSERLGDDLDRQRTW
jgi:hypothetical protein